MPPVAFCQDDADSDDVGSGSSEKFESSRAGSAGGYDVVNESNFFATEVTHPPSIEP